MTSSLKGLCLCYMRFRDMTIYSNTLVTPICDLVTKLDVISEFDHTFKFWEVSIYHLRRMRLANRGRLFLRTPGPVPFGTIFSDVETILSWTYCVWLWISNIPRYCFALTSIVKHRHHRMMNGRYLLALISVIHRVFIQEWCNLRNKTIWALSLNSF